jgi:CRP-like cAMP-binding protein
VTTSPITPENRPSSALYDLIAAQPFFHGLIPAHLQLLTASAMEMQFETGQFLLQEGSPANRFYLILEGQVVLESESPERELIPLETLGPGDELGWSWLFPAHYLQSNARALVPTRTIFFYGTRIADQCEQDHAFGYQLTRRVAATLLNRLQTLKKRTALSTSNSLN